MPSGFKLFHGCSVLSQDLNHTIDRIYHTFTYGGVHKIAIYKAQVNALMHLIS